MTGPNQTWWERDLLGVVSGKVFSFRAAHPGSNLAGRWRSPGVHVSEAGAFCERGCSRGMRRSPCQPFPSQRLAAIAAGSGRCAAGRPHAAAGEKFGELLLPPTLPPRCPRLGQALPAGNVGSCLPLCRGEPCGAIEMQGCEALL